MKNVLTIIFFVLVTGTSLAQRTDTCLIIDTLYTIDGSVAALEDVTITKTFKPNVVNSLTPKPYRTDANGIIRMKVLRESYIWVYGRNVYGFDSSRAGRRLYVPDLETCNIGALLNNALPISTYLTVHRPTDSLKNVRALKFSSNFTVTRSSTDYSRLDIGLVAGGSDTSTTTANDRLNRLENDVAGKADADSIALRIADSLAAYDITIKSWTLGNGFITGFTETDPTLPDSLALRALAIGDSLLSMRGFVRLYVSTAVKDTVNKFNRLWMMADTLTIASILDLMYARSGGSATPTDSVHAEIFASDTTGGWFVDSCYVYRNQVFVPRGSATYKLGWVEYTVSITNQMSGKAYFEIDIVADTTAGWYLTGCGEATISSPASSTNNCRGKYGFGNGDVYTVTMLFGNAGRNPTPTMVFYQTGAATWNARRTLRVSTTGANIYDGMTMTIKIEVAGTNTSTGTMYATIRPGRGT